MICLNCFLGGFFFTFPHNSTNFNEDDNVGEEKKYNFMLCKKGDDVLHVMCHEKYSHFKHIFTFNILTWRTYTRESLVSMTKQKIG